MPSQIKSKSSKDRRFSGVKYETRKSIIEFENREPPDGGFQVINLIYLVYIYIYIYIIVQP